MSDRIAYFGIRHHGPGSARRLVEALDQLQPAAVLIEGPEDCSDLLPLLARAEMKPPVALLTFVADTPSVCSFYPFALFSPEYQAVLWAQRAGKVLRFIDQAACNSLASRLDETVDTDEEDSESFVRDPIGQLALAAGYQDGESWWNDWIEAPNPGRDARARFDAVEQVMTTLREGENEVEANEARREATMRLSIANAAKEIDGPIAVVCGAWHVPALKASRTLKDDRALLSKQPKCKVRATWVPWTYPRLARLSGYGAGVMAPRWYEHLWRHGLATEWLDRWMVQVGRTLREGGAPVSTAGIIEASRLAPSLAAVRERPAPGFEEMRDAVIACLCHGESLIWRQHERALLLGGEVGEIPADTPLMPLLEDLQRQQKATRLKPEALENELALDLRSDAGSARSTLLHRLRLLDVHWGVQNDAGRSRGTFRERWTIAWKPEFAVQLVEHLVHGTTIEQAADNACRERLGGCTALGPLVELTHACLEAQLSKAVDTGLALLAERAGHAAQCEELLQALPPLITLRRYGGAREIALNQLSGLIERMCAQAGLALPYAVRNLDAEQSAQMCSALENAHQSLLLAELPEQDMEVWWGALLACSEHEQSSQQVAGLTCRLRHEAKRIENTDLIDLMRRMLSPAIDTPLAAAFFEGFFSQATQRLLYDDVLLAAVDDWLQALEPEHFQEQLPLFRRVFSSLDSSERRRLVERLVKPTSAPATARRRAPDEASLAWAAHEENLLDLLTGKPARWPT